jgi:mono/diheme cytochrome c family protein
MRSAIWTACILGVILLFSFAKRAESAPSPQRAAEKVARGEYLANHTSMCSDCHTPHDAHGMPIHGRDLQGAKIEFKPIDPVPSSVWADSAPPLAGLVFLNDQQAIVFFTTGKMPDGKLARAPMPQYRFSRKDAEALTAYLKSLAVTK